ncbi:hypothetical protein [Erythrobacter sp. F6033]|uniref:hypothetical protein n=1 Tax=Erythrobacter sp. F6033 TaxID=2926401 RepID=UPI001FF5F1EB|nr:hypothetical protein [Erythrobacter sp. F6033]MCK0128052.1 hypothetical protein [Erythrobacter sp. F6033]
MAKKHRNQLVTTAFHYLVKSMPNDDPEEEAIEDGFTQDEFERVLALLRDTTQLDDNDAEIVQSIKDGTEMHRHTFSEPSPGVYFGEYEGAYYGQKLRNNVLGEIDPESLNLRTFYYLITRLRDGKILVGVTYHGQFGDYDGIRSYLSHHLRGNYRVASKTLKSIATEIGEGHPISLKLTYRKGSNRAERRPLFGSTGEIAIKRSDFGADFDERVVGASRQIRGTDEQRKRAIANMVRQGELMELDADEIVGCSAVIREHGRQRTVYFLGDNNFATKFYLGVDIGRHGEVDPDEMSSEMLRVMRERIIPLIDNAAEA